MKLRVTGRSRPITAETGFVLPAVIFALAIMSLLAVVSLRTANDEHRSSRALRESGAALYAAEAGANIVRGTLTDTLGTTLLDSLAATLAPGDSVDLGWSTLPSRAIYHPLLHRIDAGGMTLYLLTVEGRGAVQWGGRRVVSLALKAAASTFGFKAQAAIGMYSPEGKTEVKFSGGSFNLQGQDSSMPSASDPANLPDACSAPTSENKLALQLGSEKGANQVKEALSSKQLSSFKGLKPGSSTNEYTDQGSFAYDSDGMTMDEVVSLADTLKQGATVIPTPGSYSDNFGTPTSPGVFLADGDISLGGSGAGYGVLIVTGALTISGGFTWEGLILVVGMGVIKFTGSDNKVFGAVLAVSLKGGTILESGGNAGIYYSSQALCRVVEAGLLPPGGSMGSLAPLSSRAWSEVMN